MNQAIKLAARAAVVGSVVTMMLACGGVGGGGGKSKMGFEPRPSTPAPNVPQPKDVPVDPALVATAKQNLVDLLKSPEAFDEARAIEGLAKATGAEAEPHILSGLVDKTSQAVRFAATMAAGDIKLAAAKPVLLTMLDDPDTKVRVGVRYALHRLGDFSHSLEIQTLAAADTDPLGRTAGAAAMVLGRLGEPSAAIPLRRLRADLRPTVRQQAEESLFLLDDDQARETIIGYTGSGFPDDRMLAVSAMAQKRDARFRKQVSVNLSTEYTEVNLVAARTMGAMGFDDGYGVAAAGAKSADARQKHLSAMALGAIGRADAQPLLAPMLKDQNAEVRAAASTAILLIAKQPKMYTLDGKMIGGGR